ncbi:MAG TPA: hypothetical protein VFA26_07855, partial [Gemmataceae bacterium]|nr:hypothetical protein [Gemmataceae bacterium]
LPTGNEDFVKALLADEVRRGALAEWVRRGGKVVIGCGHNQQFVAALLDKMKLIDCAITGTVRRPRLTGLQTWCVTQGGFEQKRFEPPGGVEIAQLTPGKGVGVLVKEPAVQGGDPKERPLIVQAPAGMGHVILVGLDFDEPPFTAWSGREDFWKRIKSAVEPRASIPDGRIPGMQPWGFQNTSNELASKLQDSMEHFGDITVISFGWVALFILLYIAVVGPLDYFFLKLVVKRLELTWVTFPAVVLVISVMAYFTAYWLKGNDLKINKLDVVDYDLRPAAGADRAGPRVYGHTWFTLFSPRIQHYTVGVEPAEEWGAGAPAKDEPGPLVGWMGRPENVYGGTGRGSSQSLFRRAYDYAPEAAGLEGVPIQVWATKTFSASWSAPCPARQPPFTAEVRHAPGNPDQLTGSITSHLPVELHDVVLIYRKKAYELGRLTPETPRQVSLLWGPTTRRLELGQWANERFTEPQAVPGKQGFTPAGESASTYIKLMLFHQEAGSLRNSTLRDLDQSWRASRPEEVILFGRVDPQAGEGQAEKVTAAGAAPTRLWLGDLPDPAKKRPELAGTIVQRTYVRVFIPVLPPQ